MLTKEECLEALRDIECNLPMSYINSEYGLFGRCAYVKQIEILKNLIYEHFNNPPLEWEEIKVNDVIFDKELKETIKIKDKFIFDDIKNITFEIFGSNRTYARTYEENSFYRKEVRE